ncbi:MAG: extracellular solute-binding protein, partial [Lentisphaeria bacterium]|nr:extracellular solute-binding protein [Lentisphaeria bacterium]
TGNGRTVVRIAFNRYFAEKLFPMLERHFPNVTVEPVSDIMEADAAVYSTTVPFFPGEYFLPWPQDRLTRLKDEGRLFPQIFEFHNVNGAVWGLPYLFSPDVLLYNKKIMRRIAPDFEPYALTFERLLELRTKLPRGCALLSGNGHTLLLSLIYNLSCGGTASPDVFRKAVSLVSSVDCSGTFDDFLAGKALFSHGSRHMSRKLTEDFDIAPLPLYDGRRPCHAASEALMVRNTSRHPELLFDLAEALFRPECQNCIGVVRHGVPADRAAAASSLDSSVLRDDIFFNEIKNVDYAHRHMSDFMDICFSATIKKFVNSQISREEFLREVEDSYRFGEKRRRALDDFMAGNAAVDF